ncbi:hypothetical protein [Rhodopila sp.]|uniref:hypothetical protein n=1 Tax=Rhodopila sp. TaxID=2480087 RepID=UPI003D0AC886
MNFPFRSAAGALHKRASAELSISGKSVHLRLRIGESKTHRKSKTSYDASMRDYSLHACADA